MIIVALDFIARTNVREIRLGTNQIKRRGFVGVHVEDTWSAKATGSEPMLVLLSQ